MGFFTKFLADISGNGNIELSKQLLFDKVIGFKSMSQGAGASSILYNFAVYLAKNTSYRVCILDTNFLYPVQETYLKSIQGKSEKSILYGDFSLSSCLRATEYKNLYTVGVRDATVLELLSGKDEMSLAEDLLSDLIVHFDVILVDLSSELSNFSTVAALKCNKIVLVFEDSIKSAYYYEKAIAIQKTLGISQAKMHYAVVNKAIGSMMSDLLEKDKLDVIDSIPLDSTIAEVFLRGECPIVSSKVSAAISAFNDSTKKLYDVLIPETSLTSRYVMDKAALSSLGQVETEDSTGDGLEVVIDSTGEQDASEVSVTSVPGIDIDGDGEPDIEVDVLGSEGSEAGSADEEPEVVLDVDSEGVQD